MKLSIRHCTEYRYSERVRHSTQYLRLTPRPSRRQRILDWHLDLPERAERASDGFDNILHVLTLDQPHQGIQLTARGQVEITDEDSEDDDDRLSPLVFTRVSPLTGADPALIDLAESHRGTPVLERLERLSERILADMPFTPAPPTWPATRSAPTRVGSVCARTTPMCFSPAAGCRGFRPAT
ncbi:hypothetical protein ASALC70_00289 [Alcanivorax sp. ALC70]|nr:hypothetical protein ASALC70_00289 [Alcanivorax sp. ALC70]